VLLLTRASLRLLRRDFSGSCRLVIKALAKQGDASGAERAEASFSTILARGNTRPDATRFNHPSSASVKAYDMFQAEL
jgi:hypothetical protein